MNDQTSGNNNAIEQVLSGRRQSVDVKAIEQELEELWRNVATAQSSTKRNGYDRDQPADAGENEEGPSITRACMLNLITVIADPQRLDFANEAIAELIANNPARAIMVIDEGEAGEDDSGGTAAWISAHCQRPGRGYPYVCCEQITITADRDRVAELHSPVVSLFVSDLPTCLWWVGPLPDAAAHRHLFENLARNCDLVIFTSEFFNDPLHDLPRMRDFGRALHERATFTDLSWLRIRGWRELAARLFDDSERLAILPRLDGVTLRYAIREDSRKELTPVLWIAWLAERLNWRIVRPFELSAQGVGTCEAASDHHALINLELIPGALPGSSSGTIISVELSAQGSAGSGGNEHVAARFRIERLGDGTWVRSQARIQKQVTMERVAQFRAPATGHLLSQALGQFTADTIFLHSLDKVCEMLGG